MFSLEKVSLLGQTNEKLNICSDMALEKNRNLVFVYCPPKVGSTTIVTSLRLSAADKMTVLHIHDELMLNVLCQVDGVTVNEIIQYNKLLGKNVFVIDIYREPIEHKISVFFEKIGSFHFNNSDVNVNEYGMDRVFNRFNSLFPHLTKSDYFREIYGIPVPETFDHINKYVMVEHNDIKYIKLRLRDTPIWGSILGTILKTDIKIVNDYETKSKPIAPLFASFNAAYRIPANFLQLVENDPSIRYYFSPGEQDVYMNKWRHRHCGIFQPFTDDQYKMYIEISIANQHINEVQRTHYIDVGCSCTACALKRNEILRLAKTGQPVRQTVDHHEANRELKQTVFQERKKKVEALARRIQSYSQQNKKVASKNPRNIIKNQFKLV
jgi:hypothetical protein